MSDVPLAEEFQSNSYWLHAVAQVLLALALLGGSREGKTYLSLICGTDVRNLIPIFVMPVVWATEPDLGRGSKRSD